MCPMGSISKERLWGSTVRAADQRAKEARQVADVLRAMLGTFACASTAALRNRRPFWATC